LKEVEQCVEILCKSGVAAGRGKTEKGDL